MRFYRFIPWTLCGIALLVILIWQFRMPLMTSLIKYISPQWGIEISHFSLDQLSIEQAQLSDTELTVHNPSMSLAVKVDAIHIDYQLEDVRQGRFDSISIGQMTIDLTDSDDSTTTNTQQLIESVIGALHIALPFDSLYIDSVKIRKQGDAPYEIVPIQISLETSQISTHIEITQLSSDRGVHIEKKNQSIQIQLLEDADNNLYSQIHLHTAPQEKQLSLRYQMDWIEIKNWLTSFQLSQLSLDTFSGKTDGYLILTQNADSIRFETQGDFDELSYHTVYMDRGDYALAGQFMSDQSLSVTIDESSRITANQIQASSLNMTQVELLLSGEVTQTHTGQTFQFNDSTRLTSESIHYNQHQFIDIALSFPADIEINNESTTFRLHPNASFHSTQFNSDELTVNTLRIGLTEKFNLRYPFELDTSASQNKMIQIDFESLLYPDVYLSPTSLDVFISPVSSKVIGGKITTDTLRINVNDLDFAFSNLQTDYQVKYPNLSLNGLVKIVPANVNHSFNIQHNLSESSGEMTLQNMEDWQIESNTGMIRDLVNPWDVPFDITTGNLNYAANGSWKKNSSLTSQIAMTVDTADGYYNEMTFQQATLSAEIHLTPEIRTIDSANIKVQQIDSGIMLTDITAQFDLAPSPFGAIPKINVLSLSGDILGSRISSQNIPLDLNQETNTVDLNITGLDIQQAVNTQQIDGLTATGHLDGKLPVTIDASGIHIDDGQFWNRSDGGTIRYQLDPEQKQAISHELTDVVLLALEEFNYETLTATAQYQPDGELKMNFQIEGSSPRLETDRPVHLNLNSEQNVLSLLESLRYSSDFGEQLNNEILDKTRENNPVLN